MRKVHATRLYIVSGVVLAALVILAALVLTKRLRLQSPVVFLSAPQQAVTMQERIAQGTDRAGIFDSLQEVSGSAPTQQVSYQEALRLYQGRVMQLDSNCRAMPVIMSVPSKSVVMLDNRSQWQRTVIVGPRTYRIAPLDYLLASFNEPGQFAVTCDSVQSVSIISVQ